MQVKDHPVWVEISEEALLHNVFLFRTIAPHAAFMAVVKSNAYGHGLEETVSLIRNSVDWFGVNSLEEALTVSHAAPEKPVLVMGSVRTTKIPGNLPDRIHFTVSAPDEIEYLQTFSPGSPFHLKMDTGMSRLGYRKEKIGEVLDYLKQRPDLPWTGFMTHFSNVEDVTDQDYAQQQLTDFLAMKPDVLDAAQGRKILFHAAASAAALLIPESRLDLIRVGISLYGFWPSAATRISYSSLYRSTPDLQPVMRWLSRIVHINPVPKGTSVGYGCTYRTDVPSRIAVIPVGYNEGFSRSLSNQAYVIIRGQRARVTGRVCMNMIMADVTHIPDSVPGDEVVLIGSSATGTHGSDYPEIIRAEDLAQWSGTIHYEVTTRIHPQIPRIVVQSSE